MGLLNKLRIIPQLTSFVFGNPFGVRDIHSVSSRQADFALALDVRGFTNKDWFGHQSQLAMFIEEMHYGLTPIHRVISKEGIFAADPELAFCEGHYQPRFCLAAMIDVDCHGRETEINWIELRSNWATFCQKKGLQFIWNRSRGGGLHVWFLFTEAVSEEDSQKFIQRVDKESWSNGVYDLTNIDRELHKQIETEVRPHPGSRVVIPGGKLYNNPLFDMLDTKGDGDSIEIDVDNYQPTISSSEVKVWKSTTRRAKTTTEKEKSAETQTDVIQSIVRSVIKQQRASGLFPPAKWYDNNQYKEKSTPSIQVEVSSDPYFEGFEEEIPQFMPCLLARIVMGPQQKHNWGDTIFNASLSAIAIYREDTEKALDLVTRYMNHPHVDWENNPRDREYYRSNGFNGALNAIRKGTSPSCHSKNLDNMVEHCRPVDCGFGCNGGFHAVSSFAQQDDPESVEVPYLFESRIINDPFLSAEDRLRYFSRMFVTDETMPEKNLLIKWKDWDIKDFFHFQQSLLKVPAGYNFTNLGKELDPLRGMKGNKQLWQVGWHRVLLDPTPVRMNILLFESEFIGKVRRILEKRDCHRIESSRSGGSVLVEKSDVIYIHLSSAIIRDVCGSVARELRNHQCNVEECAKRYMWDMFQSTENNGFWRVAFEKLDTCGAIPDNLRVQIKVQAERNLVAAPVADLSIHRDRTSTSSTSTSSVPKGKVENLFPRKRFDGAQHEE